MARHLINFVGGRLIRANEIELARVDDGWEVVGVDPTSPRRCSVACCPAGSGSSSRPGAIVDWASIEPFVAHVPTARLRIPYRKLARLHPAQIADLVEAASHEEGEEIIEAVGQDRELEADVFEELDTEHQVEFVRAAPTPTRPGCSRRWPPTTRPTSSPRSTRNGGLPILELLPEPQRRKVRSLLSYHPETAGGLMSPDFLLLPGRRPWPTRSTAIRLEHGAPRGAQRRVRRRRRRARLVGSVSAVQLIQADATTPLVRGGHGRAGHTSTRTGTSARSSARCPTST